MDQERNPNKNAELSMEQNYNQIDGIINNLPVPPPEDKPDADTRQALKSEGFKWAPSQGAWQRQLNQNAIRAAARLDFLRPEDGKSPYQLQPFAKRAEKDVSR